jgi:ligand-binding SRPBCC domain-containing protein
MRMETFTTVMELQRPRPEVFHFFSQASNLELITPPELGFHITTPSPITMSAGTLIDYQLTLYAIPFRWRTRITEWDPPVTFTDEQLSGPYKTWIHRHTFSETTGGGTRIDDVVRYAVPLGNLGRLALPLVRRQLKRIFAHREQMVRTLLREEKEKR